MDVRTLRPHWEPALHLRPDSDGKRPRAASGKLGREVDVQHGAEAARGCAISALAVVRQQLGSLDLVARVVKLTVFVASAEGFSDQPTVANGASDLLRDVFGEEPASARARPSASPNFRLAPA